MIRLYYLRKSLVGVALPADGHTPRDGRRTFVELPGKALRQNICLIYAHLKGVQTFLPPAPISLSHFEHLVSSLKFHERNFEIFLRPRSKLNPPWLATKAETLRS